MTPSEAAGRWSRLAAVAGADNAAVKATGRVNLGHRLELRQEVADAAGRPRRYMAGRAVDGTLAPVDNPPLDHPPGELPMRSLHYRLERAAGEVSIEDDGLTASYGIFGAPGSGKTHLLLHLLRQVLGGPGGGQDQHAKVGGVVLDPKAVLIGPVCQMMEQAGRADDLVVVNLEVLEELDGSVNLLDCSLDRFELGDELVLAAMSAGVGATEPYWFGAWKNLFAATIYLLDWYAGRYPHEVGALTLRQLADAVLGGEAGLSGSEFPIQRMAREAQLQLGGLEDGQRRELALAIEQVEAFYRQEIRSTSTVGTLIAQGYGPFRRHRYRRFSPELPAAGATRRTNIYDQTIDDGKLVLVSVSEFDATIANLVCTVVKRLFQRTVLGRLRVGTGQGRQRPLLLACDEYAAVASEVPGSNLGDAHFLSQSRQFGCMALLATQSVPTLEASRLESRWEAVFSNLGAKIFLRAADDGTAKKASELAGERDWQATSVGVSHQAQGNGWSTQRELRERRSLPVELFTQTLTRGQAVVVGSLDGNRNVGTWFVQVPAEPPAGTRPPVEATP